MSDVQDDKPTVELEQLVDNAAVVNGDANEGEQQVEAPEEIIHGEYLFHGIMSNPSN